MRRGLRSRGARALLALALGLAAASEAAAAIQLPDDFTDVEVVTGLDEPSSFAFLPDGRLLLIEQRTARVRMVVNGHLASTDPVLVVPEVEAGEGERGLLGIAVDPDWPVRPFVYFLHNHPSGTQRVVRYLAGDDVEEPNGENLSLSSPRVLISDIADDFGNHNGGGLRFGPDGMLYVSLGDDAVFCRAADTTSLSGKLLRLRVDGLPIFGAASTKRAAITPPDNPFVAHADSNARLVYALGLRNPWRFHIDPLDGRVYTCDVGENLVEEMNAVESGDFLGWPWREGNVVRPRPQCPEPGGQGTMPYRAPIVSVNHTAPVGYAIVSAGVYRPRLGASNNWPDAYYSARGDVFYGQYYEGWLRRLHWNGSSWGPGAVVPGQPDAANWATGLYNAADFEVGPDGSLWWIAQFDQFYTSPSGALHRIVYTGSPTAVESPVPAATRELRAAPNPSRGAVDLSFRLAGPERVRLTVHDVTGRLLGTVFDGVAPAGESRVRWSGTDDSGRAVAAGMYFARLDRGTQGAVRTARLLQVR